MAYDKYNWQVNDPITQERMNHIEQGIKDASNKADTNESTIATANTTLTTLSQQVNTMMNTSLPNIRSTADTALAKAGQGEKALTQITGFYSLDNSNETIYLSTFDNNDSTIVTKSLSTTIKNVHQAAVDAVSNASLLASNIQAAYEVGDDVYIEETGMTRPARSLAEKIYYIEDKAKKALRAATDVQTAIQPANGRSFADRLLALDSNTVPAMTVPAIITELRGARGKNRDGGDNTTLDQRLDFIDGGGNAPSRTLPSIVTEVDGAHRDANDTLDKRFDDIDNVGDANNQTHRYRITQLETEMSNARSGAVDLDARLDAMDTTASNKVAKTDIKKSLTYGTDDDSVLQARQGKLLKDMIGDGFDSSNTIADRIDAIDNASTGTVHGLDTRISALETEVDMTSANSRIDLVESEVQNARTSSVVRTPGANSGDPDTDTTYGSLDARLEAIETAAAATKANVDTIAGELAMMDNDTLVTTNTRVDTLENDLRTMAAELDMLDGTSIVDTNTRIDQLAYDVSHSATQDDNTTGLTQRIGVLEGDLNTATTGIKARLDAIDNASTGAIKALQDADTGLDERLDAIDGGSALTGTSLADRVSTLENEPKSATVIVPESRITYDSTTGDPTIYESDYDDSVGATNTPITPSTTVDYLLGKDDKYYYWKYIQTSLSPAAYAWSLISGGGSGNGSSSGEFAASLAAITEPDENTDYFVGTSSTGYTHYRYIPAEQEGEDGVFARILPNGVIDSVSVGTINVTTDDSDAQNPTVVQMSGGLRAYGVADHSTNLLSDFVALRYVRVKPIYDTDGVTLIKQQLIFTDTNGNTLDALDIVGGGGSGSAFTVALRNELASLNMTVPDNSSVTTNISSRVVVKEGTSVAEGFSQAINVVIQYKLASQEEWTNFTTVDNVVNNTPFTVDVSSILTTGQTTNVRVVATTTIDEVLTTRTMTYNITKVEMRIEAVNFNPAIVRSGNFIFAYKCYGAGLSKTIHFLIDGEDAVTPVTTTLHNDQSSQQIPLTGLTNGMHSFQVYFLNGTIPSNTLNYFILYNSDATRVDPIVGIAAENETITYGDDLNINYTVYTVGQETTDEVTLELFTVDAQEHETILQSADMANVTNEHLDTWKPTQYPNSGKAYVRITATHNVNGTAHTVSKTIEITINELQTDYSLSYAGTENLVYSYSAYGRTNNDIGKDSYTYTYTSHQANQAQVTFHGTFTGFNWAGNGYVDGETLLISGGATHSIDVPIFSSAANGVSLETDPNAFSDITQNGRTIEIEYEVQSATDLNATIMDCMRDGTGFRITPQCCYLLKNGGVFQQDSTGFILNESDIAAAYLTTGTRIHLVFVIEPWSNTLAYDQSYHQSVNIYVNGEFANTCPYVRGTDSFSTVATLSIGSPSCIIKLYGVKMYNRGLTHREVLQNYQMAPAATRDKITRFEDNDVLDANGNVSYEKAIKKYTCLLLTGPEPIYTTTTGGERVLTNPTISPYKGYPSPAGRTSKGEAVGKTESGVTLTMPDNSLDGYHYEFNLLSTVPAGQDASFGTAGSYCSSNNVQGTSSQKYPVHNLKVYLAKWQAAKEAVYAEDPETHEQVLVSEATPAQIKKVKYSINGYDDNGDPLGIEESTLCWKADYMSTDHANTYNANLAEGLFADKLPAKAANDLVQNTIHGFRCLLFQKQGSSAPEFIADGCLNNDKGNNKSFGLETKNDDGNDTKCQKWEFTNNSDDLGYFKTDALLQPMGEGANTHIRALDAFESTYPDQGDLEDDELTPNYNHLQVLLTWLSKRANYWNEADPTTRAAKKAIFRDEFQNHFNLNHVLTYYIFCEYTAMCDNRVKNMFLRCDDVKSEIIRNSSGTIILEGNNEPDALWSNYVNASTGATDATYIDWQTGTGHSNFAIWAPVLYDLDSCFGVENVGFIRIRYDADWDYEWNNAPQFNGYGSILWLQVADTFDAEIRALAKTLYNKSEGLNYTTLYRQQIVGNQNCISAALSNQDMLKKFDEPWSNGFINYSLAEPAWETPQYKYLQRGSRAAQKAAFINKRSKLLASKYQANEFVNDSIKFRTGVPVGTEQDLSATKITVTANQVLYPGVAYGDNKDPTRPTANGGKVTAGQSCDIYATSTVQGNDGIFICGASALTDIGDISAFRPYQLDVGAGVNLKRLIVGSNASGYTNGNTDKFDNLNKCVLLEEVNIRNCTNISILDLSNNSLIKNVYAAGSGTTTIVFPNGGVLTNVEYSANTGNITLLNQTFLTTFTYDGSATNHYANLSKLWVENTPNVPIVDIITHAMSHLSGGVRLTGLDLDLGNDTTFLEVITSEEYARGKYLSNTGTFVAGNTDYPYIAGKVKVNAIRQSLLTKLNTIYPNLIVYYTFDASNNPVNNIINEYTINYYNYDGTTLLYTDYRTGQEYYLDPVYDTNPITGTHYISMPTKPSDAQYDYTFGTYENDEYVRLSGWVKAGTTTNPTNDEQVQGVTNFVAYYPTTAIRRYTVTWYDEVGGQSILSYTANYGVDISTYTQPEESVGFVRAKATNNGYKVFKGWSRPVGKLTESINVYAQWEESSIDNGTQTIDFANLTAADVYALSQIGTTAKTRLLENYLGNTAITVPMGHDFNYTEGVNTVDLLNGANKMVFTSNVTEIKIYDGEHTYDEVRPLAINQDFTLAIDFKFLLNSTVYAKSKEYVLASCYKQSDSSNDNTIVGFKVSLNKNNDTSDPSQAITVTWGTQSAVIDYLTIDTDATDAKQYCKSYRNIIVLRHLASRPNELKVYYIAPAASANTFGTSVTTSTLTWNYNDTIDTPFLMGGNFVYNGSSTQVENSLITRCPAKAVVYWGKYWNVDLGEKNCLALAAWPHEKIKFYLSGYDNNASPSRQIVTNTNISFVAAQAIGDRYFDILNNGPSAGATEYGWSVTPVRTFCNERIYAGLSTAYQSIIPRTTVYSNSFLTNGSYINRSTNDYFYLPAEREVNNAGVSTQTKIAEANIMWPWLSSGNVTNVYGFVTNSTTTLEQKTVTDANAFRFRFVGYDIPATAKIFRINVNPYNDGGTWTLNNEQISVQPGDVWLYESSDPDMTGAYIYVSNTDINEGVYVDIPTANGGWKRSDVWELRTYTEDGSRQSVFWNYFIKVNTVGAVADPKNLTARSYGQYRILCPEFSL